MVDPSSLIERLVEIAHTHVFTRDSEVDVYRYMEFTGDLEPCYGFGSRNPYAYSDYLNINYMIPVGLRAPADTLNRVRSALVGQQDPTTGLFFESSHHPVHTTACAIAALARQDVSPLHPVADFSKYLDPQEFRKVLQNVRWSVNPWRDSNIPAGIITVLELTRAKEETKKVVDSLFDWLSIELDQDLGLWKKGHIVPQKSRGYFTYIAGAFHFLFLYDFFDRKITWQRQLAENCVPFVRAPEIMGFFKEPAFIELDCIYCLLLASRHQTLRKIYEADIETFFARYVSGLENWSKTFSSTDMHKLMAAIATLVELSLFMQPSSKSGMTSIFNTVPYI